MASPLPHLPPELWHAVACRMEVKALAQFATTCKAADQLVWALVRAQVPHDSPHVDVLAQLRCYTAACCRALGELREYLLASLDAWRPGREGFGSVLEHLDGRLPRPAWRASTPSSLRPLPPGIARRSASASQNGSFFCTEANFPDAHWAGVRLDFWVCGASPFLTVIQMSPLAPPRWQASITLGDPAPATCRDPWPHPFDFGSPDRDLALVALHMAARRHGLGHPIRRHVHSPYGDDWPGPGM